MRYDSLNELIKNSSSSRRYFLSLPVQCQLKLHSCGEHIHSARQLHDYAGYYAEEALRQHRTKIEP